MSLMSGVQWCTFKWINPKDGQLYQCTRPKHEDTDHVSVNDVRPPTQ